MKYLKLYNEQNKNLLEDLADYLQELFDKFDIRRSDDFQDSPIYMNYWINNSNNSIYIESIEKNSDRSKKREMWFKIYEEILRILPTVETRLGAQLEIIGDYNKRDFMKIKIIQ